MLVLFIRALVLYGLVFVVIRLMGKRQISELQPFDFVFTLLIADLASDPITDTSVPLVYAFIPILALYLVQQLISFLSLKSEKARAVLAGKPQIVIERGVLQEDVMRTTRYSINDLMEQLRGKDVFDITDVSYAIIETDGRLSVLKKGGQHAPTVKDLSLKPHEEELSAFVVLDGKVQAVALSGYGKTEEWLKNELGKMGFARVEDLFVVNLTPEGNLFAQSYQKFGAVARTRKTPARVVVEKNG
ncbi:DUF421 domain-containing protein [Christensenellaceae bacterium OttesenSCG-928-M15]|nr:DUF421 domain-containing protein [Christensenellaceae bacterium OttesenSCG-928-M15]